MRLLPERNFPWFMTATARDGAVVDTSAWCDMGVVVGGM